VPAFQVHGGSFWIGTRLNPQTNYFAVNGVAPGRLPKQQVGAQIEIAFDPSNDIAIISKEVQTVSLVQIVHDMIQINGGPVNQHNVGFGTFAVPGGAHIGWTIDQDVFAKGMAVINRDPRYPQKRLTAKDPIVVDDPKKQPPRLDVRGEGGGRPSSGFSVGRGLDGRFSGCALLRDQPTVTYDPANDVVGGGMAFEIAAIADPTQRVPARWLGSVSWGWSIVGGLSVQTPIALVAHGGISPAFAAAVHQWNTTPAGGGPMLPLP